MIRLVFVAALAAGPASAHEAVTGWSYDAACCSGKDCAEISSSEVVAGKGGWRVRQFTIPYGKERISPDGRFHLCAYQGHLRCFYAPGMGS